MALSNICAAQIPILNSSPAITNKVIYLDFDGQNVAGTAWNSGNLISALPSTMSSNNIIIIWKRISEDYRPFDVNITTDSLRFNNAPPNTRIRVVITPTSAWYGSAGGVAYVGSFTWGGTPGTPCWVFENQLGYSAKNIAEAAAHEVGHTLTLRHHSIYNSTCTKTAEYNPGVGTGVTSWAPIMGVGYSKNVTIWHFGPNATSCNTIQYDHSNSASGPGLTKAGYLSFIPDDVGNTFASSKILNLSTLNVADSGIISQPTDLDAYQFTICNNRNVSIGVKPWALDTTNYQGANLDVRFHLYNATTNSLIAVDTTLTRLHTLVGLNLTPGTYYFTIDGGRSANYTDYGSLGKYYVKVKATNPPDLSNTIVIPTSICVGQNTTLSYTSNGAPTNWQWTISGPSSNTFATQNPNFAFSSAGVYTISLLATSSNSQSCLTTKTINIASIPNLVVTGVNSALCAGKPATLMASGANSYTWMPGNFGGASQIVSPLVNTTYTVSGTNGLCTNSAVTTVFVIPDFTLAASPSATSICAGESVTITASGASGYTINPGGQSNSAVYFPTQSTSYLVVGSFSNCLKSMGVSVSVTPLPTVIVSVPDSAICVGESATLTASGANSYTYNPGNQSGSILVVNPAATTNYTVSGTGPNQCVNDTIVTVAVKECNLVGIKKQEINNGIRIYPNPASSNMTIETSLESVNIQISNAIGKLIYSKDNPGKITHIITERWAAGIYFVKLSNGDSNLLVEKVVIE